MYGYAIARTSAGGIEYLLADQTAPLWSRSLQTARRYATIRDATRMALRLPGRFRAYALPLGGSGADLAADRD